MKLFNLRKGQRNYQKDDHFDDNRKKIYLEIYSHNHLRYKKRASQQSFRLHNIST